MSVTLSIVEGFSQTQNIGVGTLTPDNSAVLDLSPPNNDKGILIPRLTAVQRLAISNPANSLLVFDTDSNCFFFYRQPNTSWNSLCRLVGPQGTTGATGTAGLNGIKGTTGATGLTGNNGINGTNGVTGATGPTGIAGVTGPTGAIGATGPSGGPIGPTGLTGPSSFDPHFPDGTNNLFGINLSVTSNNPYVVPLGKNLHITGAFHAYPINIFLVIKNTQMQIGGNSGTTFNLPLVLSSGDTVSTTTNNANEFWFTGYLINASITPIIIPLINGNTYAVPAGKTLYINYIYYSL